MLVVNSAGCHPFPDREGLATLVVRALDPGASPRRIRFVTSMLSNDWTLPANMAVQVGDYVVAGRRVGGSGCMHDTFAIRRAPAGSHFRRPPP